MNRTAFLFLGLSLSASAFLSFGAGCGGSGGSGTGTGGTSSATGTGGTGTGGSTTGTGGSSVKLDCASYCGEIMANCTTTNAQYTGMDTCLATCASFPAGKLGDVMGDTLGCRLYHGGAPAKMDAAMHCPHAGPSGGSPDPTMMSACGDPCEAFCNLEAVACTGANQQYATPAECTAACKLFPAATHSFSTADVAGNTLDCRIYHLTAASTNPMLHCPHTKVGAMPDPCM